MTASFWKYCVVAGIDGLLMVGIVAVTGVDMLSWRFAAVCALLILWRVNTVTTPVRR